MSTKDFSEQFKSSISPEGKELIFEFFISFSRFECALKASIEFAKGTDKVTANWDKFAISIAEKVTTEDNDIAVKEAIKYILEQPPKTQTLIDAHLGWKNREFKNKESTVLQLCQHIRDIRNNLFHGGKFNGVFQPEVSRNYKLIESAITILNSWLKLNPIVNHNFYSPIPE